MASGNTLFTLSASSGISTGTKSAQLTALTGASTPAERYLRWAFDDTAATSADNELVDFRLVMPNHYAGGGITLTVETGSAAASGNYLIGAAVRRHQEDAEDLDTTAFTYTFTDATITAASAIGETVFDNIAVGTMDSIAAGEPFDLRIRRNANSGSDTHVGDVYLYTVTIKET